MASETRIDKSDAAPAAKTSLWNDPNFRAIFFQALTLGGVILLGLYLVNNTMANLERQGIASGFGFLNTTAGFGVSSSLIEYSEESTYGRAFLVGLLNTILVSVIGIGPEITLVDVTGQDAAGGGHKRRPRRL